MSTRRASTPRRLTTDLLQRTAVALAAATVWLAVQPASRSLRGISATLVGGAAGIAFAALLRVAARRLVMVGQLSTAGDDRPSPFHRCVPATCRARKTPRRCRHDSSSW
jgi:hypothetical protein